jgi:DNA polymerase-3 subunit alpha
MKIVSRKSLGIQSVCDIGVEKDHNFLLANGLVASNCFNKSHSTAYAYITYQTAYLKANYPVEYMSALLTASSNDQEKVEKYRENCQKMNIVVLPPDINRSQKDFIPVGEQILFGLAAIKGLGENAIDYIVKAREEKDKPFVSLADFCSRIDSKVIKKNAIETLVLVGAFDKIQSNRNQLINDLDLVISWAQKRAKEKASGQTNLFDLLGGNSSESDVSFELAPSAPSVPDFTLQEKLKKEKETIGFYLSQHPLQAVQKSTQILSPINLSDLGDKKTRQKVSAVVILNTVKTIVTKQGKPMAFLSLEDVSGEAEAVVFSDTYEKIQSYLHEDVHLIIWGKVDRRDEKVQLIIEDLEPIETVKMVIIRLTLQQAIDTMMQQNLKVVLREQAGDKQQGKIPTIAIVNNSLQSQFVRFGQNFWVQNTERAIAALNAAGFNADAMPLVY